MIAPQCAVLERSSVWIQDDVSGCCSCTCPRNTFCYNDLQSTPRALLNCTHAYMHRFGYFALLIDKAEAAGDDAKVAALKTKHGHWRRMFVHTMEARRTFRFFASSGPIVSMRKAVCPWGEKWRAAFVASKALFVAWQFLDHIRFFQVLKYVLVCARVYVYAYVCVLALCCAMLRCVLVGGCLYAFTHELSLNVNVYTTCVYAKVHQLDVFDQDSACIALFRSAQPVVCIGFAPLAHWASPTLTQTTLLTRCFTALCDARTFIPRRGLTLAAPPKQ